MLNLALEVGAATESVSATAEAPIVNTTSGSLGTYVTGETISNLPVDGRNYNDLTLLQPGVSENRGTSTLLPSFSPNFSSTICPGRNVLW